MNATRSRLLLYLVLLPGVAIPWAAMIWFPSAYTTAFSFIQANPFAMLAIAITGCALVSYQAAAGIPNRFRVAFLVFVFVAALAALAYAAANFDSIAIAEAMVANGIVVGLAGLMVKDYGGRKRDT